jgi:hypothetical protein
MKRTIVLLMCVSPLFHSLGCDNDDEDFENRDLGDYYAFSCKYENPYDSAMKLCVGYGDDVTTLEEAKAKCAASWLFDVDKAAASEVMTWEAREGGCEDIASEGNGYCTTYLGNKTWTAGEVLEDRTRKEDCDLEKKLSSAWGCTTATNNSSVSGPEYAGVWTCFED